MDLLPAETSSEIVKKHRFRSLKLVDLNYEQLLSDVPYGSDYGKLDNGLTYYVRLNSKPKMRAALALAVKVGSVLEEEEERGVAHIVEHLAFSATKKYTNHDIVKFLESIGAEFGACQNAVTSADETVYELFVPVDKPELLSQAISVLAEFSSEIRVSAEDLEKERGAVMEEYRANRNANGRMQDAHWLLMMEGSKYADRLPIGLEKVIRTVSPEIVKRFYTKWYHLQNMAVIAVGDFSDTKSVVDLIKTHFGSKVSATDYLDIPRFLVPSHEEPRFSCFVESEAAGVLFTGYAYGGLSELPESEYISCSMGSTIAGEIGVFGYRPSMLLDMLAGKRAEIGTKLGAYMRTFYGDCSPTDLETALQLVYQLFATKVVPGEEDIKIVMQMSEESINAQERDPYTVFANRVRELNYGNSYFFRGGIPRPSEPILKYNRDDLKGLPFTFPTTIIREVVRSPMVEAQCSVQLCFPVELKNEKMMEDVHFTGFLSKLIEAKIIQVLRFKHGQIYSAGVSVFLGGNKPSRVGNARGDISVNFSCDPDVALALVDLSLDEILRLQEEGPSDADILTVLEIEQRAHENGLQENYWWLDRMLHSYQSRIYSGDLGTSF
ncbi:hypothetical protein M8C21_007851, partial [Ambrosia artemisiifolia]